MALSALAKPALGMRASAALGKASHIANRVAQVARVVDAVGQYTPLAPATKIASRVATGVAAGLQAAAQ